MPTKKLIKPKRLPAKKVRATSSQNAGNYNTSAHEDALLSLTDPFSSHAATARYPDQGSGKTLTFQQRIQLSQGSTAAGAAALAINPKVNFSILSAASIATNTVTWNGAWDPIGDVSTNLPNSYGLAYRPTSFGVRIANVLGATDSAGYVVIAKGGIPPALPSGTTFNPSNFATWDSHPMTHGAEWHVVSNPRSANAYDMKLVSDYNLNSSRGDSTWETVYIFVSGSKASSTVLHIEIYINYEYVAQEDAVIAQMASPQPLLNIPLQTAVNAVQTSHPPSHKGAQAVVQNFIRREGKKALVKHVIPFVAKKAVGLLA